MLALEKFIAFKYLRAGREKMVSLVTYLSVVGIAIGVTALIVALSIMNGFEKDLKNALIGANAHITLTHFSNEPGVFSTDKLKKLASYPEVVSYSPYVFRQALLTGGSKPSGALVRGIDLGIELGNKELLSSLRQDSQAAPLSLQEQQALLTSLGTKHKVIEKQGETPFSTSNETRETLLDGIILGQILAKSMGVEVGDVIQLIPPETRISPFGPLPRYKKLVVVGLYQSGLSGYDEILAFLDIQVAQRIFNMAGEYTAVGIYLKDAYNADSVKQKLEADFSFPYNLRSWADDNHNLFLVLTLEKYALGVILTLIILVSAFNIISSLVLLVYEKKRDIALLKSLGLKNRSIQQIFLIQGLVLGLIGTFFGILLGLIICFSVSQFEIISIPTGVYVKNKIPMEVQAWQIILIAAVSLLISLSVTYFPAKKASTIDPVSNLRYG